MTKVRTPHANWITHTRFNLRRNSHGGNRTRSTKIHHLNSSSHREVAEVMVRESMETAGHSVTARSERTDILPLTLVISVLASVVHYAERLYTHAQNKCPRSCIKHKMSTVGEGSEPTYLE